MATNPFSGERKLLDPSDLGTKQYWEAAYERELHNHGEDVDDEGIVWFDESNAEDTVIRKLSSYASGPGPRLDRKSTRTLDLGTGNGHMLFALREDEDDEGERWLGDMVGVDYSPKSVQLARRIDEQRIAALDDSQDAYASIRFEQWDLLEEPPGDWLGNGFDLVLDKGTFDAISLMPKPENAPHPCEVYRQKVIDLIKADHFLFITSCNWTRDELIGWLVNNDGKLMLYDEAKYRSFTFGGQTGQSVVTLVFRRAS
ncbi:uncharacterized protein MYCFIDRAFT_149699 [Pseudocercospora fijiensis CIRAD86]|uniref:Protein-lysine N-methyltransferase EFM4 n=1 Tax=Pseudocercospora fijiensis (strain CIRAD86) TaxID=383855 RepID=N1QCB5_PSEFD|nr:uncharacterized protein MYCFIDRAFT_149699 [Pseudocercospora fijiensis CIRAD86]EME89112.1 hypothetical protein MYCFIDRAFT_149699 [Pseudocercospora fijiensis CIRAD86]